MDHPFFVCASYLCVLYVRRMEIARGELVYPSVAAFLLLLG